MNQFLKICFFACCCCILSCKKNTVEESTPQTLIPFKEIPFELDSLHNELLFTTDQIVILYAATDTVNSQIKRIEKADHLRLFVTDEDHTFFKVHFLQYGSTPVSYKGFVKKENFRKKAPNSLDLVDLSTLKYSYIHNVKKDNETSFNAYGNIKLVSNQYYKHQKNKISNTFITKANDIVFNEAEQEYKYVTHSGDQITLNKVKYTNEGQEIKSLEGFSALLQRYVFKINKEATTSYAYYSKRRPNIAPIYTGTIPVYNKNNQKFVQFYNTEVGCILNVHGLTADFDFTDHLLVNFENFKVVKETVYWISNNAIIAEVYNETDNDKNKRYFIFIELNIL